MNISGQQIFLTGTQNFKAMFYKERDSPQYVLKAENSFFFIFRSPLAGTSILSQQHLFRQKSDIAGRLKCCSAFPGFHAQ